MQTLIPSFPWGKPALQRWPPPTSLPRLDWPCLRVRGRAQRAHEPPAHAPGWAYIQAACRANHRPTAQKAVFPELGLWSTTSQVGVGGCFQMSQRGAGQTRPSLLGGSLWAQSWQRNPQPRRWALWAPAASPPSEPLWAFWISGPGWVPAGPRQPYWREHVGLQSRDTLSTKAGCGPRPARHPGGSGFGF